MSEKVNRLVKWGKPGAYATAEEGATKGATIGLNVWNANGTLFVPASGQNTGINYTFVGQMSVQVQQASGNIILFQLVNDQAAPLPSSFYFTGTDGVKNWGLLTPNLIPSPHATYLVDENGNYLRDENGNLLVSDPMASSFDVRMARLPYSTYSTLQESFDVMNSPGLVTGGTFTDLGGGNLGVAAGTCTIRNLDDDVSTLQFANFDAATLAIPNDSVTRFIGVERNGGYPHVIQKTTNTWNMDTEFPLGYAANAGGTLFPFYNPFKVGDPITNIIQRFDAQSAIIRSAAGGLILGNTPTRTATLTAGVAWARLNDYPVSAKNSGTQTLISIRPNPASPPPLILTPGLTQWPNTQYLSGTTLTTMTNNRWANLWFFVNIGTGAWGFAYGTAEYLNSSQAAQEGVPAYLTENFLLSNLLVGRYIFEKSNDTPIVESAFTRTFSTQAISNHNQLSGLQGGQLNEYYHLTAAQWNALTGASTTAQFFRGGTTPSWSNTLEGPLNLSLGTYSATAAMAISGDLTSAARNVTLANINTGTSSSIGFTFTAGSGSAHGFTVAAPSYTLVPALTDRMCLDGMGNGLVFSALSATGTIDFRTTSGRSLRWQLENAGHLVPGADNTVNAGSNTLKMANTYTRNLVVGPNSASLGGGAGVIYISNATTVPTSNPVGGGVLYVSGGALFYRGSSGTITPIAPA